MLVVWFAVLASGCGGSDDDGDGQSVSVAGVVSTDALFRGTAADARRDPETGGRAGGVITVLSAGDVDHIDPGMTYYQYTFGILNAVHRGLYTYAPNDATRPVPDLAEAPPEISEDGRTVTVRLRGGVRFSRPVGREVVSGDVKYAIERAFTANVAGPYVHAYFGDLVGAPKESGPYREISGIEVPERRTLVFRLRRPTGAALAGALALPVAIPVPEEYARPHDARNPSTYGEHQVFTGPYKIEADASGRLTGYEPGRRIHVVRNPDYAEAGDFRPAFADGFEIEAGYADTALSARRILAGHGLMSGDLGPPPAMLKNALASKRSQVSAVPSGAWRLISMDTSRPPFNDINVRKAVIAGMDRTALRQQRGGAAFGAIAQHYIPPGVGGFEESGGIRGFTEFDWMRHPEGNRALAARYFRAAGFDSGRYQGGQPLLLVAANADPERSIAQIVDQRLRDLGFETKLRFFTPDTMLTRFCTVPRSEVHVCPSLGWARDFPDPQTVLDPPFNGANIRDTGNTNWAELDDPSLNRKIDRARTITDPRDRVDAWAEVNHDIVGLAPGIPYMWDYAPAVASADVRGVQNPYTTWWDLNYSSLRRPD